MNKQKIALLVDSGTDVPAEVIQHYGIYVIPLQIIYKEGIYTDNVDITPTEVYERLPYEIPSTSLPDGATIMSLFEKIKSDGYEKVLAVTISSGLSGTFNIVRLIAEDTPDLETFVLDTKNIGIGSGLQAIQAAQFIASEMPWEEIKTKLQDNVSKAKVFFNVATLEYLQKGGRIGLVASILGNALKLNPIISCNAEGIYHTVAKARGRKKSIEKTIDLVRSVIGDHQSFVLAVVQGQAMAEAAEIREKLTLEFPQATKLYFGTISPALVVHTGPGLLGIGIQLIDE